jgi:hypothetical protein
VPAALGGFAAAESARDVWLAANRAVRGGSWFLCFLLPAAKRPILGATGVVTRPGGIFTGWMRAFC